MAVAVVQASISGAALVRPTIARCRACSRSGPDPWRRARLTCTCVLAVVRDSVRNAAIISASICALTISVPQLAPSSLSLLQCMSSLLCHLHPRIESRTRCFIPASILIMLALVTVAGGNIDDIELCITDPANNDRTRDRRPAIRSLSCLSQTDYYRVF